METFKKIITEPLVIGLGIEIIALIIAKIDKSNKIAGLFARLVKKLETKQKK